MSRLPIVCTDTDASLPDLRAEADPIPLAARGTSGFPGWLADQQGRRLKYLRLSVTDRCDLTCRYCMPPEGVPASPKEEFLSFEEIVRVIHVFQHLGVRTVRLTGGEPLVRKGIEKLVAMIRDAGIEDIAMTSNASALGKKAKPLAQAGLRRLNVSLDSLNPERFAHMTRGGDLSRVLEGIDAALEAGLAEVKTNAVVVRGHNDGDLAELVEWAWSKGVTPRFIELMPLGEGAKLGRGAVVSVAEMKASLSHLLIPENDPEYRTDRGPAGYLMARDGSGRKVGFIGAVTDNFCHRCNRVRVTARGEIRACLASPSGFSLRDALRAGHPNEEVLRLVEDALFGKRAGHEFYVDGVDRHHDVDMSRIGG
ncbi:MAG: GTP 3',8-cyclase MoaA [Myxococcota bacterium]